tara:strand:- start:422 stop:625 length:204 start_codon:yes stop_codon:yes gene_type:complete
MVLLLLPLVAISGWEPTMHRFLSHPLGKVLCVVVVVALARLSSTYSATTLPLTDTNPVTIPAVAPMT